MRIRDLLLKLVPVRWRFLRIYKTGSWGSDESVSGPGSTLEVTRPIREQIPGLLEKYEVHSMLDAPCGDFNWMHEMLEGMPAGIDYTGADIVPDLITANQDKYAKEGMRFIQVNLIKDALPKADLVLCRDCFIHLSNADILRALNNFRNASARYLLTNSFRDIQENKDIVTGRWRELNLEREPFSFPPPLEVIEEAGKNGKFLGLWELTGLPGGTGASG